MPTEEEETRTEEEANLGAYSGRFSCSDDEPVEDRAARLFCGRSGECYRQRGFCWVRDISVLWLQH